MSPRLSSHLFTVVAAVITLSTGCVPNEHGRIEATRIGNLLEPPAPRGRALDRLEAECGRPEQASTGQLVRRPYLQSVTDSSAVLLWTSTSGEAERVLLTGPDEQVELHAGTREPTHYLRGASQYAVRLDRLEPATAYCYTLLDDAGGTYGPIGFRTAPARGSDKPVDVLLFGDSGSGSDDQWSLRTQMDTVPFDLIVHVGDVVYPDGKLSEYESWFFDVYDPLLASFPFFPVIGNHDNHTDGAGPYREVFALPENGGLGAVERRYSFDWGMVHFVALDTENNDRAQAAWLERDLAENDLPWVIVLAHRPAYSSGFYGTSGFHSISGTWRKLYLPILQRFQVPLVVAGHDHHYERTKLVDGITHVVTGAGGGSTRRPSPEAFTAFAEDVVHMVWLSVTRDELRLHAIDATGKEFDGQVIRRR